jgi:hypothetical protein
MIIHGETVIAGYISPPPNREAIREALRHA